MLSRARNCCIVSIKKDIEETEELCRTLDLEVLARIMQKRSSPDPHTFIGTGKLTELKEIAENVDLIVFDGSLTPSQHFRLETSVRKICIDRVGLVLEIFDRHAGASEAKAQIALARIRYELPFLREWVSKSLSDDRPGFMAGGEYAIDAYYENARRQMKRIEKNLRRITQEREARRSRRRDRGFFLVSICGYTNSGKSTLMNSLSGSQIKVDDKMFSTLSTTTRKLSKSKWKILMTDTVGFIRDLPPNLIDAFNATMEEIYVSDCAVLVLDLSDSFDILSEKLSTSLRLLLPHIQKSKIVIALNKADKLSNESLLRILNSIQGLLLGYIYYVISAQTRIGIDRLIDGILKVARISCVVKVSLKNDEEGQELNRWIARRYPIMSADWGERITLVLQVSDEEYKTLVSKIGSVGLITTAIAPEGKGPGSTS